MNLKNRDEGLGTQKFYIDRYFRKTLQGGSDHMCIRVYDFCNILVRLTLKFCVWLLSEALLTQKLLAKTNAFSYLQISLEFI